ncbi:uncharacterized protein HD556DRAFT_1534360 [Suillus plorans]|uniref:Uncharacterized protein n=1 Tax=Suillus plorans TaxID=116603 RepID=A0A9P7DP96_9AGAM|nr:uncharacterized protein HD556DRAFT_1534360 [Suillus plorans]KAG1799776.1 hypothetical protein HD556DRAFT_1534360 [Suillus plorans]
MCQKYIPSVTRQLPRSVRAHQIPDCLRWNVELYQGPQSQMIPVGGRSSVRIFFSAIGWLPQASWWYTIGVSGRACNANVLIVFCSSSACASFVGVSCLQLIVLSPELEMFVLGPRLILSVRQCHAKLVAESDAETIMNSIIFQERVHIRKMHISCRQVLPT